MLGYVLRRLIFSRVGLADEKIRTFSKDMKLISMFILNPIPIISSFWGFTFEGSGLLFFPVLGIICTSLGGIAAVFLNRVFRIPPKRAASVFTSGMFSNILTFGGLTAYVFFGIDGYVLVQLFNMFITAMYYMVGFPISDQISRGKNRFTLSFATIRERPYLLIPIFSMLIGVGLNGFGLERPQIMLDLSAVFIPLVSALMGLSIGITLFIGRIGSYTKEILLISLIKFGIVPLMMAFIGLLVGLPGGVNGMAYKILIISSAMPVAFNSLIPPALYGFDLDLANSAWVVTTFSYILILPLLYFLLHI